MIILKEPQPRNLKGTLKSEFKIEIEKELPPILKGTLKPKFKMNF